MELRELIALAKANWLQGLPRHENITDIVTRFGDLNGHADDLQAELDRLYYGDRNRTDLGNAQRMVALHGDKLRFSPKRHLWLVWRGTHWQWDDGVLVMGMAKRTIRTIYDEAAKTDDGDFRKELGRWALQSESTSRLSAMVKSAESEEELHINDDEVDSDPYLFNTKSGTIDLRTGEIYKHRPEDYITKLAPVEWDPEASGETWRQFLDDITGGDTGLEEYLARAVGYSLTGNAQEDIVFFIYGPGGNGKSTFLATIYKLMGEYAGTVPVKALIENNTSSGHRDEIATLVGTRMVLAAETPERMKIDMGLIKALTGGDAISVSRKYERSFTFKPTFKPWLYGNSKPRIPEIDDGTWRRLRLVPFLTQFKRGENEISDMEERLEKELSAVLAWTVNGAISWHKDGLTDAEVISQATNEYRAEEDVVGQFLDDCCEYTTGGRISKANLYERYKQWCDDNGESPLGNRTFSQRVRGHKVGESKSMSVRYWTGIKFPGDEEQGTLETLGTQGTLGTRSTGNPYTRKYKENLPENAVPSVPNVPTEVCSECGAPVYYFSADGTPYCKAHGPGPREGMA